MLLLRTVSLHPKMTSEGLIGSKVPLHDPRSTEYGVPRLRSEIVSMGLIILVLPDVRPAIS